MRIEATRGGATVLGGIGLGAALMYLLDPVQGRRRRALVRDKLSSALHATGDALGATAARARNRAGGMVAEARSRATDEEPSDEVLVDRVRSAMGHVISHSGSIRVTAKQGRVTLSGPILAREVEDLLSCAGSVRGVKDVENRLEVYEDERGISALQGGAAPESERAERSRPRWVPAARIAAGTVGGALLAYGIWKRGGLGAALGVAGAALVARSSTDKEIARLAKLRRGVRTIDVRRTITIRAPIDQVFDFFGEFENYPEFMMHVREVRDLGGGRTHWVVDGPAGTTVAWDAEVTQTIPNELIAWRSVAGSPVEHSGELRFVPAPGDGTRVTVRTSYIPRGGVLGGMVASLFGASPKKELKEDLARVKNSLEASRPPTEMAREIEVSRET